MVTEAKKDFVVSFDHILGIVLLFCLFPFVPALSSKFDLQPWAIGGSLSFFVLHEYQHFLRGRFCGGFSAIMFFFCLIYFFILNVVHLEIAERSLVTYLSLFCFAYLGFNAAARMKLVERMLLIAAAVWTAVGCIQRFIDPEFASIILPRIAMPGGRGVVSLAPEPSYFGSQCLFLLVFTDLVYHGRANRKSLITYSLFLFSLVFLAQSSVTILGLGIYLGFRLILRFRKNVMGAFVLLAGLAFVYQFQGLFGSRLQTIIRMSLENPAKVFLVDQSANYRLADILVSVRSFFDDFPFSFGHQPSEWIEYFSYTVQKFRFIWYYGLQDRRIMSGYGSVIFELGYVGLLIPATIFWSFFRHHSVKYKAVGIFLTVFLFSAIPLASPLVGLIVGFSDGTYRRQHDDETELAS